MQENLLPGSDVTTAPEPGAVLSVVGVRHDNVLNVRQAPGTSYVVIAELAPTAASIAATGRGRIVAESIWWEVTTAEGLYGWVSAPFTARGGAMTDWTSVVTGGGGNIPGAPTMEVLGEVAASALAADGSSRIVMVVAPTVGEFGEVTYDVVDLADETEHALRVHVIGQPVDGGFSLASAEVAVMCVSTGDPPAPNPDGHQPWRLFCLPGDP